MTIDLEPLLQFLPGWLMVLVRITGIFLVAPIYSDQAIPTRVKALLAVGLSFCIYPVLHPSLTAPGCASAALLARLQGSGLALPSLCGALAAELLIGLLIGYGATLALAGMQLGGQMIDQQLGTGLASIINPELNTDSSVVSQFYYILGAMIFVILGGHRVMLATLLDSFHSVPLGGFRADGHVLAVVLGLLTTMTELALRVAAPLLCLVFLETVALGFIARTVPQMNILNVGFPLRIIVGLGLLATAISVQSGVFAETLQRMLGTISRAFGS
jgi:flagellar biosynthetic protein FliR